MPAVDLARLADAILDGTPVDWDRLEANAADEDERASIRQLRVVAGIRQVHGPDDSGAAAGAAGAARPACQPSWSHLVIVGPLGRGAFAEVYRAWDPRLERHIALKLLRDPRGAAADRSAVVDEARLLAKVRHPNVVHVYGAGRSNGQVGVWMELIEGRSLDAVLQEHGPLSAREAATIGIDVCRALAAVHRAGVVHGDVKAQNVMRETGGRIVLMDFGAGLEHASAASDAETTAAGTPLYLAPEVFAGHRAAPVSDTYSVGVLLFHLVTGEYPVSETTLAGLRLAHARGDRRHLRDLRPDVPEGFRAVVERAIDPDPEDRFQSAGALEAALEQSEAVDTGGPRSRRSFPGRRALAAMVPIVVVVTMLVALVVWPRWPGGRAPNAAHRDTPLTPAEGPRTRAVALPDDLMLPGGTSFDGRVLSYVSVDNDLVLFDLASRQSHLVIRAGETNERPETSLPSPDGRLVAYQWLTLEERYQLRLVGADGKWPRVLLPQSEGREPVPLSWSSDGTHLLCKVIDRPRHLIQLVLVTVKSGLRRALLTFSDADGLGEPALSPDGRFVAFDRTITVAEAGRPSEPRRHVYLLDVRAPAPKRLGAAPWNDGFPQWLSHGRSLFLLSDRSGEIDAWIQPVSNGAPAGEAQLVLRNLSRATPRGMTKDGTLYYDLAVGGVDVYTTTLDGAGAGTPSPPARIPARLSGYNISGSWSPDGSRLVFLTTVFSLTRSPLARVLTVLDTKSGEERHLAPGLAAGNALPRWSPDGRQVLVRAGNSLGQRGLFAVDVASGAERLVLSPSGDWPRPVIWSHDGHALLYVDDRGFVERDLATASERLLVPTERIGDRAVHRFGLSPDGRRIAYTTLGSPTREPVVPALWLVVPGGVPRPLFRGQRGENFVFQAWSPDGREVIVARGRPLTLAAVSVESGQVRSLGLQVPGANINLVSLNPDGRRVAFTVGSPRIELWAADGFLPAKAGDR